MSILDYWYAVALIGILFVLPLGGIALIYRDQARARRCGPYGGYVRSYDQSDPPIVDPEWNDTGS